ncbi:MAG: Gfo/Idh/MocA family oxidoreductase [Kiritimatiellales bacterium]|nr:Gfo/Idh/MocA family oxidoreductase [Kiritimatiellales bacterium]
MDKQVELLNELFLYVVLAGGVHHHTKGAFSGRVMWADLIRRTPEFIFYGWAPSPVANEIPRHAQVCNAERQGLKVTNGFSGLVKQCVEEHGRDHTLACISVDTGLHVHLIQEAVEAGARFIWCDKPIVVSMEDLAKLEALQEKHSDVVIFGVQNHRYCAAVMYQRAEAQKAKKAKKKRKHRTGFGQAWLLGDQESRQALSRLDDFRTTLSDLGAHCFDLEEFINGADVSAVHNGQNLHGLSGDFADNITGGTCELEFVGDPQLSGHIYVDQCLATALMDDLWSLQEIEGQTASLWRMGRHSGSSIALATVADPDINNPAHWDKPLEFGADEYGDLNGNFAGWSPPGHDPHCWPNMWRTHAKAILGAYARIMKLEIAKQELLPWHMLLPVPTLQGTGKRTAQWIKAHVESANGNGKRVSLGA